MRCSGCTRPPLAVDRVLFDSARELLANVVKHAGATTASVTLARTEREATLVVTDDGVGIDPGLSDRQLRAGHVGLATRRIRVEVAGGSLAIAPSAGGGTTITISVPLG